ncbi:uncharacterized protein [Chelonus insularis]|uniref:uncharacterized protein isoform X2 n=1 Tax=Chelonus insularis TaxID=460826 RepID=UPI00158CAB3F|nr:uncharacterized protein LOC118069492 isoform X2 [Chelonus insularis]
MMEVVVADVYTHVLNTPSTSTTPRLFNKYSTSKMGLRQITEEQMSFYTTLTAHEKSRLQPCIKARCVMMSRDSGSFDSRTLPPTSYDLPDDARPGVLPPVIPLTSTTKLPSDRGSDVGGIEEVATITKKTLPSPEPRPKIQHNGNDSSKKIENKLAENTDDDACVKCIYFTQQMCECVIV